MESWNSEDLQRDEHGDGQNRIIPSLDPENESECSIGTESMGPACEKRDQFFTASADSVSIIAADGIASTSEPGRLSPSSRIQEMIENKGAFSNDEEFEIHYSTAHWSELQSTTGECSDTLTDAKYLRERNRKSFDDLEESFNPFLWRGEDGKLYEFSHKAYDDGFQSFFEREGLNDSITFKMGKKIAQGGQGEIFEAGPGYVVKLFDLSIPPKAVMTRGLLDHLKFFDYPGHRVASHLVRASLVEDETSEHDGRFYIVMDRFWGDLRKLIDQRMMGSNNQGPPFTTKEVLRLIHAIAYDMWCLHKNSILHRDLKAANVLVQRGSGGNYNVIVADYESSDGVVGTGFWRAPEILQQLKDRKQDRKPDTQFVLKFTEECDVYSFGMTCYELVTGRIPFEGYPPVMFDLVLSGTRPELPGDVDPLVKGIMTRCWHSDPSQRPSFLDICSRVDDSEVGRHMSGAKHGHDERFSDNSGVVIPKYWGDLRMLKFELKRLLNTKQDLRLMYAIARVMCDLHKQEPPIIHGDLDASNVLVYGDQSCPSLDEDGNYMVTVADYKCESLNYRLRSSYDENWLAPEIIQQIKNMERNAFLPWDLVTKESDVYGYGMTCYELVRGRTPFDDEFDDLRENGQMGDGAFYHRLDLRERILNGGRPNLPADLDPLVEEIITSCWNHDPSQRPTFLDICNRIANSPGFQPSSSH